jgi:hypothetical protein
MANHFEQQKNAKAGAYTLGTLVCGIPDVFYYKLENSRA